MRLSSGSSEISTMAEGTFSSRIGKGLQDFTRENPLSINNKLSTLKRQVKVVTPSLGRIPPTAIYDEDSGILGRSALLSSNLTHHEEGDAEVEEISGDDGEED